MNLYILRHAIAEDRQKAGAKPDSQRRLTREGKAKMRRIAEGMEALGLEFELILTSPYRRARETAEVVADVFKQARLEVSVELTPSGHPRKLIEALGGPFADRENVLLVGHEPYLSGLISLLLSGETGLDITLKKGGLCKLQTGRIKYGRCASLEWLLAPRHLKGLSGGGKE